MNLPTPPSDEEKGIYQDQGKLTFYLLGAFSFVCLASGAALFVSLSKAHWIYGFFYGLILVYIFASYLIGIFGKGFNRARHEFITMNPGGTSSVDIFLPVCGEKIEIIENTWDHVSRLKWDGPVTAYVLDDGADDRLIPIAEKYGFIYIRRENRGELKKAGNMRHAFPLSHGEFIAVFDADFAPRPDFLLETMPYFVSDQKIAIVQTPQFFTQSNDQGWIERGAASIQELFYRLIQVNRNTWGAAICVGTNAVYRRAALEPYGGTAAIAYSEDLHTGFNCLESGWKVEYVPINLAKGVCPDSQASYFMQQYRWAMGSTSLLLTKRFWSAPISVMQRVSFLSGMGYYVATAVGVFLTPIPGIVMVWAHPEVVTVQNCLFALPSFMFTTFFMKAWNKSPFGVFTLRARIIAYYAHIFAIFDQLRRTTMPWVPTGSDAAKKSNGFNKFRDLLFVWVSVSTFLLVGGCFYNMHSVFDYHYYPPLFFSAFNYYLSMGVLRDQ